MNLPKHYYPTIAGNPIHEVKDWAKVRSLVRVCINGKSAFIPPIYTLGDGRSGSALTGTHRAAANEIIEMLNDKNNSKIEMIEMINVKDFLNEEQINEVCEINDDVQELIEQMIKG